MTVITLKGTALEVPGKKGIMVADADGYYDVCLGAVGVPNRTGLNYTLQDNLALFTGDSEFMERVKDGKIYAENGHPVPMPGESTAAFIARASMFSEPRVCAHISSVRLDSETLANQFPGAVIIYGKVKPYGELKHVAEDALKNKMQNCCFSLRCLKHDYIANGKRCRKIIKVIGFDLVLDQGVAAAQKQYHPGFESMESIGTQSLDLDIEYDSVASALEESRLMGLESATVGLESFLSAFNTVNQSKSLVLESW